MAFVAQFDLPAGAYQFFVEFAPNRGVIVRVVVAGVELQARDTFRIAWVGTATAEQLGDGVGLELQIEAFGVVPSLLRFAAVSPAESNRFGTFSANGHTSLAALLNARMNVRHPMRETVDFFFYLDAWTTPAIAAALRDPEFLLRLSGRARSVLLPFPSALDPTQDFVEIAGELVELALCRPHNLLRGTRTTEPPAGFDDAKVHEIAAYLAGIFERVPRAPDSDPLGDPLPDLERAFARFAAGHLAFVPKMPGHDILNAEPNSEWFFAFGEFALRAYDADAPPSREYWFELARLFAVLIEPFTLVYGRPLQRRGACRYRRENRNDAAIPDVDSILKLVDRQRELIVEPRGRQPLDWLFTSALLWATRDEAIDTNSVCKLDSAGDVSFEFGVELEVID